MEYSLLFSGPLSRVFFVLFCLFSVTTFGHSKGSLWEPYVSQSYEWTQFLVSIHAFESTLPYLMIRQSELRPILFYYMTELLTFQMLLVYHIQLKAWNLSR